MQLKQFYTGLKYLFSGGGLQQLLAFAIVFICTQHTRLALGHSTPTLQHIEPHFSTAASPL